MVKKKHAHKMDSVLGMASCGSCGRVHCMLAFKHKPFTISFNLVRKHSIFFKLYFPIEQRGQDMWC